MIWTPIIGQKFSATEFDAYVRTLKFDAWRPSFVVVHNTSEPTRALYGQWKQRTPPVTMERWMQNLVGYYRDQQGWSAGPHLFVADDGIGVFTPLTGHGTHTPSWNAISWGVETVGEFETEAFDGPVRDNLISALASLHSAMGLNPADYKLGVRGLHFHKEDIRTTHQSCPGRNMVKSELVAAVVAKLAEMHPGEHQGDRPILDESASVLSPQRVGAQGTGQFPMTQTQADAGLPAGLINRFTGITATVFGGDDDAQPSAYADVKPGWPKRPGVALPARFNALPRPKVRVACGSKSVDCEIVDVGPWNTKDPYWATGNRPQAESGTDLRGRHTNLAGIDLTPAAAAVLGIDGKGVVDWQFVS
jgi:hypothetical protein